MRSRPRLTRDDHFRGQCTTACHGTQAIVQNTYSQDGKERDAAYIRPPSRRTFTERRTSSKKAYHASYTQNAFANKRPSSAGCIPIGELVNPPEHAATYETGHRADASADRGPCHTNSRTKHASTDHVCGRSHPRLPTGTAILGGVRRFRLWTFFKLNRVVIHCARNFKVFPFGICDKGFHLIQGTLHRKELQIKTNSFCIGRPMEKRHQCLALLKQRYLLIKTFRIGLTCSLDRSNGVTAINNAFLACRDRQRERKQHGKRNQESQQSLHGHHLLLMRVVGQINGNRWAQATATTSLGGASPRRISDQAQRNTKPPDLPTSDINRNWGVTCDWPITQGSVYYFTKRGFSRR